MGWVHELEEVVYAHCCLQEPRDPEAQAAVLDQLMQRAQAPVDLQDIPRMVSVRIRRRVQLAVTAMVRRGLLEDLCAALREGFDERMQADPMDAAEPRGGDAGSLRARLDAVEERSRVAYRECRQRVAISQTPARLEEILFCMFDKEEIELFVAASLPDGDRHLNDLSGSSRLRSFIHELLTQLSAELGDNNGIVLLFRDALLQVRPRRSDDIALLNLNLPPADTTP